MQFNKKVDKFRDETEQRRETEKTKKSLKSDTDTNPNARQNE